MNNNYGTFIQAFEKYGLSIMTPFSLNQCSGCITPPMLKKTYGIPALSGNGITVGIIAAFEYTKVIDDLLMFCKRFSLSPGEVKTVNMGSFSFATNELKEKWINEAALDLQWTRSFAPDSDIICYFAKSDDIKDIFSAIKEADKQCDIVLLCFGVSEFAGQNMYEDFFENSAAFYICASGNNSSMYYPSSSKFTLSVGATEIYFDTNGKTIGREHYKKGGCGISKYTSAPEHQKEFIYGNENNRVCPDISFFSGGNRGVYFYCDENGGDLCANGTSVSAACVAGICAGIASVDRSILTKKASFFYELAKDGKYNDLFYDITMGRNELHKTTKGFDLCTGLGTPNVKNIIQNSETLS